MLRGLVPIVTKTGPRAFRRWIVDRMPFDHVQDLKRIADTMHGRSVDIFNARKAALESGDDAVKLQIGEGRDIMSILGESPRPSMPSLNHRSTNLVAVRENMHASEGDKLPDEELIAQVS